MLAKPEVVSLCSTSCGVALRLVIAFSLLLAPSLAQAGVCDVTWDGDKVVAAIAGRPGHLRVPLRDKQQRITELTVDQIQAFSEAKDGIARAAGSSPNFVICDSTDPNAFATKGNSGDVVGVTAGMMRLVNGDRDMAAAVLGHEFGHHTHNHMESGQARDAVIGLLGLVLGAAIDARSQRRTGVPTNLGQTLSQIGSNLVSRKFDRDQEREADSSGFQFMVAAGFNPLGSVRLADRMNQLGLGGVGLFFDSHPGWTERAEQFKSMIASNPRAQELIARSNPTRPSSPSPSQPSGASVDNVALAPTYETTDAQKSFTDGMAAWRAKDVVTAVREWRSAANSGYAPAQVVVGYLYSRGQGGLPQDPTEAVRLYRIAADQDNALAQANLGYAYTIGYGGLPKDDVEAVRLLRLSADQGNPQGQVNLGALYTAGRGGLAKDMNEAVRLYQLSAQQGNALGRANLGHAYSIGVGGLPKDLAEAVRLFRLAADQGNPLAQANLGHAYSIGAGGLAKDDFEAARLFRLAADQGHPTGQANLGFLIMTGRGGMSKDENEAARLFQLAAAQGSAIGQNNLGWFYENGRGGLTRNVDEAISLYQQAAAQGFEMAIRNLKRLGRM